MLQRALEAVPLRGKGRIADLLLRGRKIEVSCHPLPGLTIYLDTQQRIERLMWAGAYERSLVERLKSFLKPGMVFLDLGANIGYFSAIAAALVGASGRVFAFEPSPACFSRLRRNLFAFGQAVSYNCAVSDANAQVWLYLHPHENGWGSLFPDRDLLERVQVDSIRLDDWAQTAGLERLDFVKMDIEGGEYAALLGARTLLRRFRPAVVAELNGVCLARNQRTPDDVLRLLSDAGYKCQRTGDSVFATSELAL
jgi:FkbM family methyltransferase